MLIIKEHTFIQKKELSYAILIIKTKREGDNSNK